ncbi:MAG: carboxypeptidase-like regulatory domain-containing protein [Cyclobacteriaceae bacterium]|nr:carboxypeptidase-like regulatory domain-containing protein [Cyclobacteriaceae bacterium]
MSLSSWWTPARDNSSKEYLSGVNIKLDDKNGTYSNGYGFYSLKVQAGVQVTLHYSFVGYQTQTHTFVPTENVALNIDMLPKTLELSEVLISSSTENDFQNELEKVSLDISTTKDIPALVGEKDVIKVLQLLPGAQRGTEGSTALYVRGGSADQNLIMLDDALVYNANHLFGFFSIFNGDALKSVDYWKGGFPARYGGRISSVIDIKMKDGNKHELKGEGGIGLLSSRLTLEGPIKKEKSSFLFSTRRSYIDIITRPFMSGESLDAYRFYDLNTKFNTTINERNNLFLGGYLGNDRLLTKEFTIRTQSTIKTKTDLGWGNATGSLRWNHVFGNQLFANTTLLYSHFRFYLQDEYTRLGTNANSTKTKNTSAITDYSAKVDLDYFPSNKHVIKGGLALSYHIFSPRDYRTQDQATGFDSSSTQIFRNKEVNAYVEDTWTFSSKLSANYGIRIVSYDTYFKNYAALEPRMNLFYALTTAVTMNASYTRANQFVHLLSNTGIGLSTDLWVPVTEASPPQQADQLAVGVMTHLSKPKLTISIESYRKYLRNMVAYKSNAPFLVIDGENQGVNWEDNITIGKGWSYGTEVLVQKKTGTITGWIGYTLSWTIHQFDEINNGKRFFPRQDSRHNISLVGVYTISPKVKVSATWVYGTGNALTVPQGFYYGNTANGTNIRGSLNNNVITNELVNTQINSIPYFGSQNSFRAEAYHRMDVAIQLHKKKKRYVRYWEFGLFNAYNRQNPFYYYLQSSYDFASNGQRVELKKKSLFPILPSITYNFKF